MLVFEKIISHNFCPLRVRLLKLQSQISLTTTLSEIYPLWRYALPWERTRTSNCFLVLLNFFSKSQHTRHVFLQCSSHSTGLPQLYQLLYFLISHFLKNFSFSLFQLFLLFFRLQFGKGNASLCLGAIQQDFTVGILNKDPPPSHLGIGVLIGSTVYSFLNHLLCQLLPRSSVVLHLIIRVF